jgi:penicillin-binding protein 1A
MVLGGLKEGATPLGWTYAYTTIGNNGDRVSGTLAPRPGDSPVAYTEVTDHSDNTIKGGDNDSTHDQVFSQENVEEEKRILETVVSSGTGTHADIGAEGQWGKTGTTENNGDAWFCGGIQDQVTACVWVGYADSTTPMTTLYNGGPVMGGTYPALIWASVISAWESIQADRAAEHSDRRQGSSGGTEAYTPETSPEVESEGGAGSEEAVPTEPEAAPEGPAEAGEGETPAEPAGGGGVSAGF